MTLDEAKEFYVRYLGSSFHMDREEPARYGSFMMLGLGKDTLGEWDEELLERLFGDLRSGSGRAWVAHGRILDVIRRNNCDVRKHLGRLLDEMERMARLDTFDITLVLENMAGRNESMSDGGAYVFCGHPDLVPRMNDVVERLIAACSERHDVDDRFERAVGRYRRAYEKWLASSV